jgi:hypothetical protein
MVSFFGALTVSYLSKTVRLRERMRRKTVPHYHTALCPKSFSILLPLCKPST